MNEDLNGSFPKRCYVQGFGGTIPPESKLVKDEMERRGVHVEILSTEDILMNPLPLTKDDLVVGDFAWTRKALDQLGVSMPEPPDYPDCLSHLLHRKIWTSTLADVKTHLETSTSNTEVFIKPAADTKAFSGLVATKDWMDYLLQEHSPTLPVLCSEIVRFVAEYRVYVVRGQVRGVGQYMGSKDFLLDPAVLALAAKTLAESKEGQDLLGFGMDFALMEKADSDETIPTLVEVNDGFSLGYYEGVSGKDYTELLIARWGRLMGKF
mmetsp:Transcript_17137/g.48267  ORF Transcript_17137/g.48267 Transcript_17137/m.48267 type:complete len:266 (-) Transcript_17137:2105-2902(-)